MFRQARHMINDCMIGRARGLREYRRTRPDFSSGLLRSRAIRPGEHVQPPDRPDGTFECSRWRALRARDDVTAAALDLILPASR